LQLLNTLFSWVRGLFGYALKFGIVGLIGVFIDVLIFNLLSIIWRSSSENIIGPLGAKIIAVIVSTLFTWVGNRLWTFRAYRRKNYMKEALEFFLVSFGGMVISVGCLWISHYVLGFTSLLADNIAANVIGFSLATVFRFFLYKYWVYSAHRTEGLSASNHKAKAASLVLFENAHQANKDVQA
jgi:putative flippase GtrA